jgi:hypothetical protein
MYHHAERFGIPGELVGRGTPWSRSVALASLVEKTGRYGKGLKRASALNCVGVQPRCGL